MAQSLLTIASDTYYVSVDGADTWSGTLPEPNPDRTDGPFRSVWHAQQVLRALKSAGMLPGPVRVLLRGGRYLVPKPLVFTPDDSMPVTYASYPGEEAVLCGGRRITGWRTEKVHGGEAWVVDLPDVAAGRWYFRELFVSDRRRPRPRLPKQGLYRITDVPGLKVPCGWGDGDNRQFRLGDGQMKAWRNLTDVEIVAFHFWIDERFPVSGFDEKSQMISSSRGSFAPLVEASGEKLAPVFIDNVFEALTEPGEWYLDRAAGRLYYLPMPGEDPETTAVFAPASLQLLRLEGKPEQGKHVEWLRFENLSFEHTDWVQPGDEADPTWTAWKDDTRSVSRHYRGNRASAAQAAADLPGAISLRGARNCTFAHCRFAHLGWYALDIGDGCLGNRIVGNEIYDLGGGGIHLNGAAFEEAPELRTGNTAILDNHIHEGGRVFHASIGILSMHAFGNTISHNHIHDFYYSGISCGWVWGYKPNISRDNVIEKNHIHDLGHGLLSDMGGIYTLGVQPGTVLRGNLIHDVTKLNYGAWCLYTDEGSSHILLENNVCYRTNGEIFHQHYGRENIVRNNIFAFGGESVMAFSRGEEHNGFTLEKNIFITHGPPIYRGGYNNLLAHRRIRSDMNLIWHSKEGNITFSDKDGDLDFAAWQALGHDLFSMCADPQCADPAKDDFTLADSSPAFALGFQRIDMSDVGPRQTPGPQAAAS